MHCRRLKALQPGRGTSERGQTIVFVLMALSLFLIAAVGLTVDISNLWFHRQMAQGAADAACTAGAMDMYVGAATGTFPANANFTPGTAFDCGNTTPNTSPATSPTPCWYASTNGYPSPSTFSGLTPGQASNNVYGSFPSSVPGVTTPPSSYSSSPFLRIDIVDRVQVFFMALLTGSGTQDVRAFSECGLQAVKGPLPVAVLDPNGTTPSLSGPASLSIVSGGSRSLQVNLNYRHAISGLSSVNLCQAGPDYCGGSLGVWGSDAQDVFFVTACSSSLCTGTQRTPTWDVPSAPTADPFAQLAAPAVPGTTAGPGPYAYTKSGTNGCVSYGTDGYCDEYGPGYYKTGLCVIHTGTCPSGVTGGKYHAAIFDPGVYYITGGMYVDTNSCVRPSAVPGSGVNAIGGTMFYFSDANSISFNSSGSFCPAAYSPSSGTPSEECTGTSVLPTNIPSTISGSVLLGPCTGTYGDPLGTSDPNGEQRGILFFQNRSQNATTNPSFLGGGQVLAAGIMYFHQCVSGGSDTGVGCASSAFNDTLSLGNGTAGAATYVLGGIVADHISLTTGSSTTVNLSSSPAYNLLKTSVLR